jgi:hypothetical protein
MAVASPCRHIARIEGQRLRLEPVERSERHLVTAGHTNWAAWASSLVSAAIPLQRLSEAAVVRRVDAR